MPWRNSAANPVTTWSGSPSAPEARRDQGVVLDVHGAGRGIRGGPRRHGPLLNSQRVLELVLVAGPGPEHPAGRRVGGRGAERGVQAPPDLVDEVVVVG